MAKHTLGRNGLLCVPEQGGGTILTPLSGHALKAGLTAHKVSGLRGSLQRHAKAHGEPWPAGVSGFRQNGGAQSRRPCTHKCSFFRSCKVLILVKASFFTCKWLICHLGIGDCGQTPSSLMKSQGLRVQLVPLSCPAPLPFQATDVCLARFLYPSTTIHSATWVLVSPSSSPIFRLQIQSLSFFKDFFF